MKIWQPDDLLFAQVCRARLILLICCLPLGGCFFETSPTWHVKGAALGTAYPIEMELFALSNGYSRGVRHSVRPEPGLEVTRQRTDKDHFLGVRWLYGPLWLCDLVMSPFKLIYGVLSYPFAGPPEYPGEDQEWSRRPEERRQPRKKSPAQMDGSKGESTPNKR